MIPVNEMQQSIIMWEHQDSFCSQSLTGNCISNNVKYIPVKRRRLANNIYNSKLKRWVRAAGLRIILKHLGFLFFVFFTVIWNNDSVRNKTFWKWEFKLRTRKKVKQQHISIILKKKKNTCFSISVSCDIEDQHYQYYSPGGTHCWCAKHSEEQNRLFFS